MRTIGITALAAFLALAASQAAAQTILWGKVEADMPAEAARALYPEAGLSSGISLPRLYLRDFEIDGCKATVNILTDKHPTEPGAKVTKVELYGEKCDAKMYAQLIAKYGAPADVRNDTDRKKKKAVWVADGKTITFKAKTSGVDFWELTYSPVKDLGL